MQASDNTTIVIIEITFTAGETASPFSSITASMTIIAIITRDKTNETINENSWKYQNSDRVALAEKLK